MGITVDARPPDAGTPPDVPPDTGEPPLAGGMTEPDIAQPGPDVASSPRSAASRRSPTSRSRGPTSRPTPASRRSPATCPLPEPDVVQPGGPDAGPDVGPDVAPESPDRRDLPAPSEP